MICSICKTNMDATCYPLIVMKRIIKDSTTLPGKGWEQYLVCSEECKEKLERKYVYLFNSTAQSR